MVCMIKIPIEDNFDTKKIMCMLFNDIHKRTQLFRIWNTNQWRIHRKKGVSGCWKPLFFLTINALNLNREIWLETPPFFLGWDPLLKIARSALHLIRTEWLVKNNFHIIHFCINDKKKIARIFQDYSLGLPLSIYSFDRNRILRL